MRISLLTFGAIASILTINSVFATTSTVTSKDYVDAADALKQNKIPATGTNAATPGSTVVTYTGTAGQIGERGIIAGWENYDYANGTDDNKLVTAGAVVGQVNDIYDEIYSIPDNLPNAMVTRVECAEYQNGECILFSLREVVAAFGGGCSSDDDCYWLDCAGSPHGSVPHCHSGIEQCACVRPDEL